ncbi:hypothetical protein ACS0TY_021857 [Phlomoides rotata]
MGLDTPMQTSYNKILNVLIPPYTAKQTFAVFDVNAIEEPWEKDGDAEDSHDEKPSHVPPPILAKLTGAIDDAPHSWEEVSKALEDLKPKLNAVPAPQANSKQAPQDGSAADQKANTSLRKNSSFHTLEELEAKISPKPSGTKPIDSPVNQRELRRFSSAVTESKLETVKKGLNGEVPKSLRDNIFILKDKLEREKDGKAPGFVKRDPLSDFKEMCPPGGADSVVFYSTSLGGVRRTYEDCSRVKQLLEIYQVVFDERDVALHGGFLNELRELLGEEAAVPRVFVKGRYIGGVEEVVGLNETGRLSRILNWARVERGVGRLGCVGCGGARTS